MGLSVDEFFKEHSGNVGLRATLEPTGSPDRVVVTPWVQGAGCLCAAALELTKDTISNLTPTSDSHYCCGKMLRVVALDFKTGTLPDIFVQLIGRAMQDSGGERRSCTAACDDQERECIQGCEGQGPGCKMGCTRRHEQCIQRCRRG